MTMSLTDEQPDLKVVERRARSIAHLFVDRVAADPDREAFRYPVGEDWKSLTWLEVDQRVRRIAAGLVDLGVEPEDRVAVASATRLEWALADLGIMLCAAATTTIYPSTTADEVRFIIADSGSVVVFAENEEQVAKLREGRDVIPDVRKVVLIDGAGDHDWVIGLADLEARGAALLEQDPDVLAQRLEQITPDSLATLIYTSGTTGRPKGVRLPHDAWTYEGAAVDSVGILGPDDLQYLWLPLAHVFGKVLLTLPLQIGFPTAIDGRVDKIVDNLPIVRPTWMGAAPRIFEKVYGRITTMMAAEGGLREKLFDWSSANARKVASARSQGEKVGPGVAAAHAVGDKVVLRKIRDRFGGRVRFFISGSAALNRDVAAWFEAMGMPILEGYGLTETSAATCVNRPYGGANVTGTVGWPVPGTQIAIADDGEVLVKGPGVMRGYRGLDDATAESLVDGWFHTGDIGELLPTGHLRITDRKKDLFKTSNGKYVAPSLIEATFKGICPYASQFVVEGDGRKFVSALVTLDGDSVMEWGTAQGMDGADYRTVVTSDAAREMVQAYVDELNLGLNRWEQIKRFIILPRDLTVEDGEITPSLKIKRTVVIRKFKTELDGLYD